MQEFTKGMNEKMIPTEHFYTVPDEEAGFDDPRSRGARDNLASSRRNDAKLGQRVVESRWHLNH